MLSYHPSHTPTPLLLCYPGVTPYYTTLQLLLQHQQQKHCIHCHKSGSIFIVFTPSRFLPFLLYLIKQLLEVENCIYIEFPSTYLKQNIKQFSHPFLVVSWVMKIVQKF